MSAVPVVLSPEPFSRETVYAEAPSGSTVRVALIEAVRAGQIDIDDLSRTTLYVDGARIDRVVALDLVLAEGQVVNLVVEPLGGGGSSGGKDIGQLLLTIAVIAVSAWVGGAPAVAAKLGSQMAARIAGAAIMAVGQAAIGAIYAPDNKGMAKANDSYALQSASNQYRPWAPFPMALGEVVAAPDLVAKTFTESRGDEQWIYGILGVHYGPCETSEEKIGDTLVSTMGAGDVRIVKHLTPGPRTFSLYPNDVDQLDLSETFDEGVEIIRAASAEGERFDIDIYFPSGLYWRNDKGRFKTEQNDVQASWRPIDEDGAATGDWSAPVTWTFRAATNDPIRRTQRVTLPLGRYEFRLKKLVKPNDPDNVRVDAMYWTAIKSVAFRKPVTDETLSIIEFAVRATALNQGSLAPITCRIKPLISTWTGAAWSAPVPSSNPAALTRWLLTGPAPARPLLTTQADTRLRAWAALCDTYGWTANIYLTDDRKQDVVLGMLGLAGRASLFWDGTQIAASPWVEKPAPRQLFGGDNLRDHKWSISYAEEVHALRVEFQNIDQGGEADQVYVYADGYGETAGEDLQAATLVEALRLEGQRTIGRAYRDGRWELGRRIHQRRIDTWSTDIENIASALGDRVRLAYSRVDGGQTMRVRCRRWSGGLVSGLRLAEPVEMEAGKDYAVDLRLASGLYASVPIVTTPGQTREIVFQNARQDTITPAAGDKVAFGVPTRISEDVEIIGIEPGENLTASLVGVRYVAPLLMAGETGPIPPLQTRLTGDRQKDPPAPTLLGVQVAADGVRVGFAMPPWKGSPLSSFAVRWRSKPEIDETTTWAPLPSLPADAMILTTPPLREAPVEVGGVEVTRVEIEIAAVTVDGRRSTPLLVTASEPVVATPLEDDWSILPSAPGPDGVQMPSFDILGEVPKDRVARVLVEFGPSEAGPWKQAFDGAPVNGVVSAEALLSAPGMQCWFAISYWSLAAIPSGRFILGPYTAPGLIASDTANLNGEPASSVTGRLADAETLILTTVGRVDALEVVVSDTEGAFNEALVLAQQYAEASEDFATAADASATASQTVAGQSLTYLGLTTEARDDAVLARIGAETAATTAAGAAATAMAQASQVSDDAASASLSAQIAASLGAGGGTVKDPMFQSWPLANPAPDNLAVSGSSLTVSRETAAVIYGDKALRLADTGTGNVSAIIAPAGMQPATPATHWVVEYQFTLNSGDLKRLGAELISYRSSGFIYGFVDIGVDHTAVVGQTYRGSKLFELGLVNGAGTGAATDLRGYFYTNYSGFSGGAFSAKNITLHMLNFRPATAEEIAANEAIPALEAAVAVNTGAVIDLETQLQNAFFEVIAAAGGDPAQLLMKAGTGSSLISLAASSIILKTVSGGTLVEALKLIGGEAYFGAPVSVTVSSRRLTIGPGFGTSNQCVLWFGPSTTAIGSMTRTNGYFALGTDGEVYLGTAKLGQNTPKTTSMTFSGNAGYSGGAGVPVNTAGTTPAMTVPQTGKIVVDVSNVFALSEGNGSSDLAIGYLELQIGKNGTYTTIASNVLASTSVTAEPGSAVNAQALNKEVVHNFAGPVTFRVRASGAGASTNSRSVISGSLRATHYAD